ncbi:hypothetical protein M758_11G005000 [Ceratodon purpureus]|nr:hypothetical protein M758_11G005000 [Ceratodon purpureus]
MKIRRRSEKQLGVAPDGVPPLHTLITCTYQKLFRKEGGGYGFDSSGAAGGGNGAAGGPGASLEHKRQKKLHRHEPGSSWANGARLSLEAKEEGNNLSGVIDVDKHGDGAGHESRHDLQEARTNPLLPKRRKVKSTRYADFAEEATPHSLKAEKRSRQIEKDNFTAQDTAEYINTVASSKEALIASIFYVFDTLGKSGLTASEVVAIMLEQMLPGLKEGGARHTVQVANVLRRSRHFISIGNKQYLPCRVVDDPAKKHGRNHGQASKSKQGRAEICKLYDGSGWHCSREAHLGFSLCVHHLDMINRPLGKVQAPTSPVTDAPVNKESPRSQHEEDPESDSDCEESEDIGPALAKWGRDRTPGSAPNQKRKMLSLMSIK